MKRRKFSSDEERAEARRARWRKWASNNPGARRANRERHAKKHPDTGRRARRKWMADNKDKMREYRREWVAANPAKKRAKDAKRRADTLRATPPWANHKKIAAVYAEAERLTIETGVVHEVDHFYPLRGRDGSCGLHVHENLRVVPQAVNRAKSNASPAASSFSIREALRRVRSSATRRCRS